MCSTSLSTLRPLYIFFPLYSPISHFHSIKPLIPNALQTTTTVIMNNRNTISSSSSSSSDDDDESGWTLYLDNSTQFLTTNDNSRREREKIPCAHGHREGFYDYYDDDNDDELKEEEEEDLSMLSDASSGPPHFEEKEAEELFSYGGVAGGKKRGPQINSSNVKLGRRRFEAQNFTLDDTASSRPIINMIFSSKENGGHCVENQASSVKNLIDYSSQGFSATHYQVVVENQSRNRR